MGKYLKIIIMVFAIYCIPYKVFSQTYHQLSLSRDFSKDGINNGMLFKGIELGYKFGILKNINKSVLDYSFDINISGLKNRGILGIGLKFKPISISYNVPFFNREKTRLFIGPKFEADYRIKLYPDLQMGNIMWVTNYTLSPQVNCIHRLNNGNNIRLYTSFAILGLTSRTEEIDPYYFSLKFTDVISKLHSKMRFSMPNNLVKSDIGIDYIFNGNKRNYSIGYELNYLGYKREKEYKELNHAITFKIIRK